MLLPNKAHKYKIYINIKFAVEMGLQLQKCTTTNNTLFYIIRMICWRGYATRVSLGGGSLHPQVHSGFPGGWSKPPQEARRVSLGVVGGVLIYPPPPPPWKQPAPARKELLKSWYV